MTSLGLRSRLALAMAAVALLAVALAALIGNLGLTPRLDQAARSRLGASAAHLAGVAAAIYGASAGWSSADLTELEHLAALDNLHVALRLPSGDVVAVGPPPSGVTAEAAVAVDNRTVATVVVSAANGNLLTSEERHLAHSLDRLHLFAAAAAVAAALIAAGLLAETLTRPLRRIRAAAERLERGELSARVEVGAEPETASLGRALNRLAATLEHEEQLRKEGVADLAHELRTPVNGLLSRIEAAQDHILPAEENLAAMHNEAVRLARLLNDLARLADAERPGLLVEKTSVDLAEVAGAVAGAFKARFEAAGIALSWSVEPAPVYGDPGRLEQIVTNLVSNALAYTQPGGKVTLTVAHAAGQATLEVADTGIGIAPEDLAHVFTRFWRADRSRSPLTGGTGIGLAIVRELVRAHDGRIDVESTPAEGSRFRVTLPAGQPGINPVA